MSGPSHPAPPKAPRASIPFVEVQTKREASAAWDAYTCTLKFFDYRANITRERHLATRRCLEATLAVQPADASAWAMLAMLHFDESRASFNRRGDGSRALSDALSAARKAVAIDDSNPRAWEALSLALYFNQDVPGGRAAAERALALAPNDPEILGEIAARIATAGEWNQGHAMLLRAVQLNPGNAGYYSVHLAFIEYMQNNLQSAAQRIRDSNINIYPLRYMIEALIQAELGNMELAAAAREKFVQMQPEFLIGLEEELAKRNMQPQDRARVRQGLIKAGMLTPSN